jgi:hypothetical protein
MDAVFAEIYAARLHVHMEYYAFEDVHWAGRSLVDVLVGKCRQSCRLC